MQHERNWEYPKNDPSMARKIIVKQPLQASSMTHPAEHRKVSMLVLVQSRNLEVQRLAGLDPQAPELVCWRQLQVRGSDRPGTNQRLVASEHSLGAVAAVSP
jgi:hypothetical protein